MREREREREKSTSSREKTADAKRSNVAENKRGAKKFKFSVVMPIYNVEKYLAEAIDSVIAQDIGFRKNVQLILVNDGSPDNSGEICEKYAAQYPENIFYYKKKNGGLSDARNFGLRHVVGELITFTDPDDTLSENVFSEVWDFYKRNREANMSIINIPLMYFEAKTGLHPKYRGLSSENVVVDLNEDPNFLVMSSASSFYPRETFRENKFNVKNFGSEDFELNLKIQIQNPIIGYVCENDVLYNYRIRDTKDSIMNQWSINRSSFICNMNAWRGILKQIKTKKIPAFVQYAILYDARGRILYFRGVDGFSKTEKSELEQFYTRLTKLVDNEMINEAKFLSRAQKIIYFSRLLSEKPKAISDDGLIIFPSGGGIGLRYPVIKFIRENNSSVEIDVLSYHYGLPLSLVLKSTKSAKIVKAKIIKKNFESSYDERYGKFFNICPTTWLRFSLDKTQIGEYEFFYQYKKQFFPTKPYRHRYLPFAYNSRKIRKNYGEIDLKIYDGTVEILTKGNRFDYLKSEILTTFSLLRRYHNVAKTRFLGFFAKKWILISDRPFKAGDNGEALFKYIAKNEPEIKKYTRFVLEKNSPDYERMKQYGKVVPHGSLRHKFYFLNSKLLISSHNHPKFISPDGYKNFHMHADLMERKMIWLQHGVTKDNIFGAANKFNQGLSAVVLSTDSEKKIFSQENFFYDEKDLITSGFPRWDYNENNAEKLITIAPTWRSFLSGAILENGTHEIKEGFEDSEYFRAWSGILANQDFLKQLRAKNIKIDFLMHPAFIAKVDLFKKFENDVVRILEFANYQEIFAKSALMITDFSSAVFDFAYLRKPVLYYQFDKEEFFASHYQPSKFFDYEKNAPGAVVTSENDLIREILKIVDANFAVPEKYRARAEKMFFHNDKNNSRRVVEYLKKNDYL